MARKSRKGKRKTRDIWLSNTTCDPWLYPEIGEGKAVKNIIGKVTDIIVCVSFLKKSNSIIVMYGNGLVFLLAQVKASWYL